MSGQLWTPGDICWVQCTPSVGNEYQGRRPCVVIQSGGTMQHEGKGLITVMVMTSYKNRQWKYDILVQPDASNRLHTATLIKVRHIMSFDSSRLVKKIGTLDASSLKKVREYLSRHFDL